MATIAVVDDSISIRQIFEYYLQDVGHTVLLAANGIEGLKLLAEHSVDVALVDANMPGMHGLALCEAAKANPLTAHVPVVLMTACVSRDLVARALAAGALEVLSKPFDVVSVEATLRHYAETAARTRAAAAPGLTAEQMRAFGDRN